jgi:hypothetical protein
MDFQLGTPGIRQLCVLKLREWLNKSGNSVELLGRVLLLLRSLVWLLEQVNQQGLVVAILLEPCGG